MRQRLMQVLGSEEEDAFSTHLLTRFWSRAKPLPVRAERRPDARVIDLAQWASQQRDSRR